MPVKSRPGFVVRCAPLCTLEFSHLTTSTNPFPLTAPWRRCFDFPPPTRGGRSAGGARMHARHPSRRVMTDAQTPLSIRKPGEPALRSLRTTGEPRAAIDLRRPGNHPALREASCVPSDGTLAFRRSTWDFWPGPVLAVVSRPPISRRRRGIPSGIVRHSTHGSSLPGGAGLANLPGAAANRLRGHHNLAPPCKNASGGAPLERGWVGYMYCYGMCQAENAHRS